MKSAASLCLVTAIIFCGVSRAQTLPTPKECGPVPTNSVSGAEAWSNSERVRQSLAKNPSDENNALRLCWLITSANKGNAHAMNVIAGFYLYFGFKAGQFQVPEDHKKGWALLGLAASMLDPLSMWELAMELEFPSTSGMNRDLVLATKLREYALSHMSPEKRAAYIKIRNDDIAGYAAIEEDKKRFDAWLRDFDRRTAADRAASNSRSSGPSLENKIEGDRLKRLDFEERMAKHWAELDQQRYINQMQQLQSQSSK